MLKLIAAIGAIQVVAIIVNLLRSKAMAVLLGPQGVGVVSIIDQFVQLVVQITAIGLPFAAVKFLSRSHSRGAAAFRMTYASLLRLLLTMAAGGMLVALGVLCWRPGWFGSDLAAYRHFLFPALLSGPFFALHGFFLSVLAAARQPRTSALLALVIVVALTVAVGVGIFLGGIAGLYWAMLLASFLIVVGVLVYFRRTLGLTLLDRHANVRNELRANRDIVPFSLILYGTSFTYTLAYFAVRYGVLHNIGERGAGLLQAAIALSGALYAVLNPTNGLYLTPILNRDISVEDKVQAAMGFQARLVMIVGVMAMPIVLFPQLIVSLLFSPQFAEVSRVLFVFVVAQCIGQLNGVTQSLLIGLNDLKVYGAIVAFGHLVTVAISWLLIPTYGVMGAGIALLVSSVVVFVLTAVRMLLARRVTMPPSQRALATYVIVAVALVGWFVSHMHGVEAMVNLSKLGIYFVFMGGLLLFADSTDRRLLARGLRRWRLA